MNKINSFKSFQKNEEVIQSQQYRHFQLNASFPVMVYIHGGGFYSNNLDHYPPNYMMERDIVLVVVQYRLDALGK